ncbi:MAG: hypothetical protein L3J28_10775 [Candidatus Polarisedimenticolaceae bacterium]|nr:hypothetical protein [Candidatus Polarisedimenticolaceae bacterium]
MSTKQICFIAYSINTAPKNPTFNAGQMPSGTYLGLDNPEQDIQARCQLIKRAIETAADQLTRHSPPYSEETLKVFMAPEFFFRGKRGAYQMDEVSYAISQLQTLVAAPQWENWIFVFGSLVATVQTIHPQDEAYNFALVQQGGVAASGDSGARIIMKELKSGIDFISSTTHPGDVLLGGVEYMQAGNSGSGRERQQVNYDGAGIFDLGGITWALEVCLDHGASRLQQSPQLPGESQVQIQLVPSCGMTVTQDAIITAIDGLIFNCDGGGFGNTVNRVTQTGSPPTRQLQPIATPAGRAVSNDNLELDSPPKSITIDALFAQGPGEIVLYPPLAYPAAQPVPGTTVTLTWKAADNLTFTFSLNYDSANKFSLLLCRIQLDSLNFHGHDYFMPLSLSTVDRDNKVVEIKMHKVSGSGGYDAALWCNIQVPGFQFEGVAFEYYNTTGKGAPKTCW